MTDRPDIIAQPATVPIGAAFGGATAWAFCGALVITAVSFWWSGAVWWDGVLIVAVIPFIILWLGLAGLVVRVIVSWNVKPAPNVVYRDNMRLVPMYSRGRTEGLDRQDLAYFVKTALDTGDWSQRAWRAKSLPSGRKMDTELHGQMMAILDRYKVVLDYGPRQKGKAAMTSDEALQLLGLSPALPGADLGSKSGDRVQSQQFSQSSGRGDV